MGLSLHALSHIWILIIFSLIVSLISYLLSITLGKYIVNEDTPFYTAVCIASAFPNAVSLPIMILETACKRSDVNEEYNSDPDECYTASMSMLFVYSIGWNFVFWGFGRFELEKCSKLMTDQTNRNKITSSSCASSKVSITGAVIAIFSFFSFPPKI